MSRFRTGKPSKDVRAQETFLLISMALGIFLDVLTKTLGTGLPVFSAFGLLIGEIGGLLIRNAIRKNEKQQKR